jgi:hypothetical protein
LVAGDIQSSLSIRRPNAAAMFLTISWHCALSSAEKYFST